MPRPRLRQGSRSKPYGYSDLEFDELVALSPGEAYEFIELFAGAGNVSRIFRYASVPAASMDIQYGRHLDDGAQDPMDFTSDSGFSLLNYTIVTIHFLLVYRALKPTRSSDKEGFNKYLDYIYVYIYSLNPNPPKSGTSKGG